MNIIQKAEKKPDPKAAALPFYKRFTYPFTRKQVDNMLMMPLLDGDDACNDGYFED